MSQNGHEERSCAKRSSATNAIDRPRSPWTVRPCQRRPRSRLEQPPLPLLLHFPAPPSRAIPDLKIRPMRPADERHGNRQYLRTRRETAVLGGGMGKEYPLLPRPPSDRPGRAPKIGLVGALRPQRIPVFHAPARGAPAGGGRAPRVADGGRPSRRLHGPHTNLPRASGEAESAPRRLCGVLLSEGHRPLHDRCVRIVRRSAHREPTRKIPVCTRRVLPKSVPQPAHALWQTAAPATIITDSQFPSDRTAVFRPAGREDAHRDPHKGHAALRQLFLVAVHGDHVTYDVETAGGGLIDALRLPAVSAQPALRPVPKVPEGGRGCGDVIQ